MIVVADSSPLRYLIVFGQQDLLPTLFGETWIPTAVLRELHADLVLMDDAAGRREALSLRLRITGTVGVLRLANDPLVLV
jgi:predicted nucleic acid-binding protein